MANLFTIGIYLVGLVALLDQSSKAFAVGFVGKNGPLYVTPFFNIVLSMNKGITFGLFNNHGDLTPYVLIGLTGLIILILLRWLAKAERLIEAFGLGLILGGAAGNVADRMVYGAVVDFLDFHYAGYHWYTFNLADAAIVMGVGLLMLDSVLLARKNR